MGPHTSHALLASMSLFLLCTPLRAQNTDARQHLEELARANSLDAAGTQPWHLRMTFQLNDLEGKPKDSGTIEEWWVSPESHRLEIRSASYNLTIPSGPSDAPEPPRNRESYLVNELLDELVHPIPDYGDFKNLAITEASRTFGKVTLSCISVAQASVKATPFTPPAQFCFEPGSTVLRGHLGEGQFSAARNRMGIFRGIELGLESNIAYGPRIAITGHLDVLESLQPNASITLTHENAKPAPIPGVVLAGHIVKRIQPTYPMLAREEHISGTVLLCAKISKQGTISSLDVLSSPDRTLTAAAIDAVKQWTYLPYTLNGKPTEVDTTITVNFNLGS